VRGHLLQGLRSASLWHRLMLQGSAGYRRLCHVLAVYLTTGYWDLRPPMDDDL
jgi:hypothetical protein